MQVMPEARASEGRVALLQGYLDMPYGYVH